MNVVTLGIIKDFESIIKGTTVIGTKHSLTASNKLAEFKSILAQVDTYFSVKKTNFLFWLKT